MRELLSLIEVFCSRWRKAIFGSICAVGKDFCFVEIHAGKSVLVVDGLEEWRTNLYAHQSYMPRMDEIQLWTRYFKVKSMLKCIVDKGALILIETFCSRRFIEKKQVVQDALLI